jgi:hypothetical protein
VCSTETSVLLGLKKNEILPVLQTRTDKGAGIFLHELQLYDSFRQKCSILDALAAQGLKIQEWE